MSNIFSSLSISRPLNNFCIETANLCFMCTDMELLVRKMAKVAGKNETICFRSSFLIKSIASLTRLDIAFKTKESRSIEVSFWFKYFHVINKFEASVDTN